METETEPNLGSNDFWVVKIDGAGIRQWDKAYGLSFVDEIQKITATPDGGFLLVGHAQASGASTDRYRVVKVDASGAPQWDNRFGGSQYEYGTDVALSPDGGYLLAGISRSPASGDKTENSRGGWDIWVVKIDATGNKQWDRTYGGSGFEQTVRVLGYPDGGYLLVDGSDSPASGEKGDAGRGGWDFWRLKIDAAGNKEWIRRFGGSGGEEAWRS